MHSVKMLIGKKMENQQHICIYYFKTLLLFHSAHFSEY